MVILKSPILHRSSIFTLFLLGITIVTILLRTISIKTNTNTTAITTTTTKEREILLLQQEQQQEQQQQEQQQEQSRRKLINTFTESGTTTTVVAQHIATTNNNKKDTTNVHNNYNNSPIGSLSINGLQKEIENQLVSIEEEQQVVLSTTTKHNSVTASADSTVTITNNNNVQMNHDNAKNYNNSTDEQQEQTQQVQPDERVAVIHIGPLKTGSSSIQYYLKLIRQYLNEDQYEIPTEWPNIDMGGIKDCFLYDYDEIYDFSNSTYLQTTKNLSSTCDINLMSILQMIGTDQYYNIVISAESFSFPQVNIQSLKKFLQTIGYTKFIIVMYYRRYYDWLYSNYNQYYKYYNYTNRISFPYYIQNDVYTSISKENYMFSNNHYTYALLSRWSSVFTNTDSITKVYNVHDERYLSNIEKFYCTSFIPPITKTCNAIKTMVGNNNSKQQHHHHEHRSNVAIDMIYYDLAIIAITNMTYFNHTNTNIVLPYTHNNNNISIANLKDVVIGNNHNNKKYITKKQLSILTNVSIYNNYPSTIDELIIIIQYYQENILNKTKYQFIQQSIECITDDSILDDLLEKTYDAEEELFPQYYNNPILGRNSITNEFLVDSTTKLCSINPYIVLQYDTNWYILFTNVSYFSTIVIQYKQYDILQNKQQ